MIAFRMVLILYIQRLLLLCVFVLHSAQPPEQDSEGSTPPMLLPYPVAVSAIWSTWQFGSVFLPYPAGLVGCAPSLRLVGGIEKRELGEASVSQSASTGRILSQSNHAVRNRRFRERIKDKCKSKNSAEKEEGERHLQRIKDNRAVYDKRRDDMAKFLAKIEGLVYPKEGAGAGKVTQASMTWSEAFEAVKGDHEDLAKRLEKEVAEAVVVTLKTEEVQGKMQQEVQQAVGPEMSEKVKEKVAMLIENTRRDLIREDVSDHLGKEDERVTNRMHSQESSEKKRRKKSPNAPRAFDAVQKAEKAADDAVQKAEKAAEVVVKARIKQVEKEVKEAKRIMILEKVLISRLGKCKKMVGDKRYHAKKSDLKKAQKAKIAAYNATDSAIKPGVFLLDPGIRESSDLLVNPIHPPVCPALHTPLIFFPGLDSSMTTSVIKK